MTEKIRNEILKLFENNGIYAGIHYPNPVHKQKGFKKFFKLKSKFTNTNNISRKIISLPMYPEFTKKC